MIDWPGVAANAAWILGCALALATLSFTAWLADLARLPWRKMLDRPAARGALALSGLLFCLGLAGTAILGGGPAWEAALWLILALAFLAQSIAAWRRPSRA